MLFFKSTAHPVAAGIFMVDIAAKPPGRTFGVYLAVSEEEMPHALLARIEALGYQLAVSHAYTHQDGKRVVDLHFHKVGSDIFDGWTMAEKEVNLAQLEKVFAAIGITIAPRVMRLAEAF